MPREEIERLCVDGKFFRSGGRRVFLKMVTYGPFPKPRPEQLASEREEMERVAAAGFNALRVYEMPSVEFLDTAAECGLWVFAGLCWEYGFDFVTQRGRVSAAKLQLDTALSAVGGHRALAGVFVANEIPGDMVRWMGVMKVRAVLEDLISLGRMLRPELLFAYSNFPTTEYLEPNNADFTAMNVYLEQREEFIAYLPRLHNVAGDRPVLLSEVGFDSERNGVEAQAEVLGWSVRESLLQGMAGVTLYAWSDWWLSGGKVVTDWSFGLNDRSGVGKMALNVVTDELRAVSSPEAALTEHEWPMFSVIVCTYNGANRMDACLSALFKMGYPNYEVIVVDDGSTDHLVDVVRGYPEVKLVSLNHGGLSAARNRGAAAAEGEFLAYTDDDCQPDAAWLFWLADAFIKNGWHVCGGPNLPPLPEGANDVDEAVVASAPGAPSHVLLTDQNAEHLPGCNIAVRKVVFDQVGGFRSDYRVAGDDVDFCWRIQDAGYQLGFCGAAFVWHRRRTSLWRYFKQQLGYGKAEALLMRDHPEKFSRGGGARWSGIVYTGGALSVGRGDVIYHGAMGTAGYQQISTVMQPQRPLPVGFDGAVAKGKLALTQVLQPLVRRWARKWYGRKWQANLTYANGMGEEDFLLIDHLVRVNEYEARWWSEGEGVSRFDVLELFSQDDWEILSDDSNWDLARGESRLLIASEQHAKGIMILTRIEMRESSKGCLPRGVVVLLEGAGLQRSL